MDCIYRHQTDGQHDYCLKSWNESSLLTKCNSELLRDCSHRLIGEAAFQFQAHKCDVCGKKHGSFRLHLRCRILNDYRILAFSGDDFHGTREDPLGITKELITNLNLWPRFREIILERDCQICSACGSDVSKRAGWLKEVHHIIPRIEGGSDHPSNLQTLCAECHREITQNFLFSRMPSTESEWKEWHLNRKFQKGRDLLRRLVDIKKDEDV